MAKFKSGDIVIYKNQGTNHSIYEIIELVRDVKSIKTNPEEEYYYNIKVLFHFPDCSPTLQSILKINSVRQWSINAIDTLSTKISDKNFNLENFKILYG